MSDIQKGYQITSAFQYIQQVFKECQRLIFKIDNQMAPEWGNLYGNRITKDVSASLQEADRWIVEAIFRVYQNNKDKLVNKCITITFWGDEVEQPIITAGKIVYSDVNKRSHWDLWYIWFDWSDENEDNRYELDGKVNAFRAAADNCKYINEAFVFSLPLISITDDEALIEKIIKPLKEL
ncbi:MAG: hypothetical protein A4E52_02184 [Pelotomaculum sp. PtaB.Bin013]|uniref:Uncharacterized protein n=1 Tax=Pelotomaculum isophthalicicum JI TaxID=947010 RepID=A0A9X4H4K1_9FIRM|nr:hypothetical protein [Pelotomaculum isophthalicicum]MDF9408808.1 hypothetical protein [Pelotomaculum isophthalicicum JI]OPX81599.1 MAG: hypothetical protein A4E52_02184 [Pelotomaculum sp. PtaB.Bin013]